MIPISSTKEINKILRNILIKQSELPAKRIVDSLSTFGETLDKLLEKTIYDSYKTSDSVILFELLDRDSSNNMSYTKEDSTIKYQRSFEWKLIIYGNDSSDIATKIVARYRTQKIRDDLQNQGIYLEEVTEPTTFNEFKNNVIWLRNDLSINITCEFEITQIDDYHDYNILSDLKIIKEGE